MIVSVLQWNVWLHEKPSAVVNALLKINADIICLQEVVKQPAAGSDIECSLVRQGYNSVFAPTITKSNLVMGNAVFSRYPLINSKEIFLQKEAQLNIPGHDENRIYLEASISLPHTSLTVGNVHLSSSASFMPSEHKDLEADRLYNLIAQHQSRYVLAGDLNYHSDSEFISKLGKQLVNAGPEYNQNTWPSRPVSYPSFEPALLSYRPDYIFISDDITSVRSCTIQTDASDHLPILVELQL